MQPFQKTKTFFQGIKNHSSPLGLQGQGQEFSAAQVAVVEWRAALNHRLPEASVVPPGGERKARLTKLLMGTKSLGPNHLLLGSFNPFEKYAGQIGSFPQFSGWK